MPAPKPKGKLVATVVCNSRDEAENVRNQWSKKVTARIYTRSLYADRVVFDLWVVIVREKLP
jgi:hypothetical protein